MIISVTVGVVLMTGGGVAVMAAREVAVGPSCCQTPSTTVTEYGNAVIGYGYLPETDEGTARTIACSPAANAQASTALQGQVTSPDGIRPDRMETLTDGDRPGVDGGRVVYARIEVTVSLSGTYSATGFLYADVALQRRGDGRWCVKSWTPTKEAP